jgi:4-amino-4-deoxy-L-arabinose transferase-like glycosyltransferase
MRRVETIVGAAAVGVLAAVVLSAHLGSYALWDPDEARHAEIARELFTATDWSGWLLPQLNYRPYYDKPILFYWLVAAAYAIGGVSELAARSVPVAAALATTLAVYAWAARVWNARAAVWAAVVLVTAGEFPALGRYANLDMLLTLWVTLGILAVHRWTWRAEAGASLVPAAVCGALGMLTKGLVAPVLIAGVGVSYLALTRRIRLLGRARWGRTVLAFVGVAGPWYTAVGLLDPAYLHEFFVRHHYQRFFEDARYLHPGPMYYYLPMVVLCFFPWSMLLPAIVRGTLSHERRGADELFCACWAVGVIAFFSLASGKLATYLLPALPPLALLTGRYVSSLTERQLSPIDRRLVGGGMIAAAAVFIGACPLLMALSARLYDGAWVRISLLAGVFLPFGVALAYLVRRGHHGATPAVLALAVSVGALVFYRWAAPAISAVRSEASLAAIIARSPPDTPIVAFRVRTPSLLFYIQRRVREIDQPARLANALARHPLVFVVTSPKHLSVLNGSAIFPWRTNGRHLLYASQPPPEGGADGNGPAPLRRLPW